MRYTVHIQRTFHHRITKYFGVLVAAALIATLGLPSAAQAQSSRPAAASSTKMLIGLGHGQLAGIGRLDDMDIDRLDRHGSPSQTKRKSLVEYTEH